MNLGGSLFFGGTVNPGGLAGQMFIAVDRSGGPTNNNVYMVASVSPFGGNGTDVMFVAQHRRRGNFQCTASD